MQEEEKDVIVHQLSTSRGVKKSLKSLPRGLMLKKSLKSLRRGIGKAANNIKHYYKTTADSIPEWLTLYGDDERPNTEKSLVTLPIIPEACDTKLHPISFTFSRFVLKAVPYLSFSLLSKLVLFKPKKITTLEIVKTVKTLNLAKERILPNLTKKRILPKK